nr:Protein tyrosine phosphatase [Pandoravirus aubagnensis]
MAFSTASAAQGAAGTKVDNDNDPRAHASIIYSRLYLGGINALEALMRATPVEQADWCVLTFLAPDEYYETVDRVCAAAHHKFAVDDAPHTDLSAHFSRAHELIESALARGQCALVHCAEGTSRSPTVVCAHLMFKRGIDAFDALDTVKSLRPQINPSPTFRCQLMALSLALAPSSLTRGMYCDHSRF